MRIVESVVAVSGGARGIGAAIAEAARRRGASVAIGDLDLDVAAATAERIGAVALALNVTSRESWDEFRAGAEERLGPIDVLVNNAGIMSIGPFLDEPDASTARQLDVNVHGVLFGAKTVLPGMLERRRGHVINVASMAGKLGIAGSVTYCGTKFAVVGITQALDDELKATPVAVTCVLPGLVNTELAAGLPSTRLTPRVEPSEIADAVMAVIERPRGEIWVPQSGRAVFGLAGTIPNQTRSRVMRLLGIEDPMLSVDQGARADYETRATRKERV